MQSETANYYIHQPNYQNKYNAGWNQGPENFSENGEHFFDDYVMTSSQLPYGDVTDDVTSDSVLPWFASDNRSMCGYSCQGNRPDDRLTRVGCQSNSFNDHQVSMQQHPFHCFNQPMDRLSGMDNWTSADYQSHSDSDCSLYSPGVEKTDLNSVRTWAIKQEQFESQNFLSSSHSLNENQIIFNQLSINHSETQLFNLDDHQHYRLEALSSSTPSNAFIPPSNNTARLETIKAELWTGAPQTWSHSSSQSQATNTPGHPSTQIINKSQNKIFKRRLRRRRRRGASKEKTVHLWEFIRDILLEPKHCPSLMKWEDRGEGVFRFVKSNTVATMWGKKKDNPKMTYEKLSRAMRYYYNRGILERVDGRRLVYKFGPNAHGWRSPVATKNLETEISTSGADDVTSQSPSVVSNPNTPSSDDTLGNLVTNLPPLLLPSAEVLLEKNGTRKGS